MELAVMHGIARVQIKGHNEQRNRDLQRGPARRNRDWVADIVGISQMPGAGRLAPTERPPGHAPMDTATLRARIDADRQAAIRTSRLH